MQAEFRPSANRLRKLLIAIGVLALPAAAHTYFKPPPAACFAAGSHTFRISRDAIRPDFRVRIDNAAAQPDLRIRLVDTPETADFVLADDFDAGATNPCRGATKMETVRIADDEERPDLVVSLNAAPGSDEQTIYVHSARFSHRDAAALYAVMTRNERRRDVAARE